jgi:hypothetical protein
VWDVDRSDVSRALAKTIAYKESGKDELANEWATRLFELLERADIHADLPLRLRVARPVP